MFNFFAYLSRMRFINRWSLMRNSYNENILEHSADVAILSHCLASIGNTYYNKNLDIDRITSIALFHDTSEVITGDLPTPIKYYNPEIKATYSSIEKTAKDKLISFLPDELKDSYNNLLSVDTNSYEYKIVKAADKLSALIKCIEELKSGNKEFVKAKKTLEKDLKKSPLDEVSYFMTNFIDAYSLTLDELE